MFLKWKKNFKINFQRPDYRIERKYIFLILFIFASPIISASTSSKISGKIEDSKKEPAAFVNVILLNANDSSVVKGVLSTESGNFFFENIDTGNYFVLVSQLGDKFYTPTFTVNANEEEKQLQNISLPQKSVALNAVEVSASRPFIEHRLDETVINVENSIVDAGGTAIEVLKRSPGVTVDVEGNIHLAGKQGVLIMIDGKPTYLSPKDLFEFLRNTSSDQLSQIVIMTNPSAKYDASGNSGIINIKMKKKQNFGLNGNARISYGQGVYPDFGTGFGLNYRNEKFNAFGGYDFMRAFYFEEVTNIRKFNEGNYTSEFEQGTFDKGGFYSNNFRGGIDYNAGAKTTIGALVRGNLFNNHDETSATTDITNTGESPDSGYVTQNINDSKWNNISTNLNYLRRIDTLGSELSADADFVRYDNASNFQFITDHYFYNSLPGYSELATSIQPAKIQIRSFKVDYVKQFQNKMKLESGGKTSFVKTDNDVKYYNYVDDDAIIDTGKTNHFIYKENINAAYFILSGEFGKWGLKGGLRAEQTIAEGEQTVHDDSFKHNYIDLFPSVFINYNFSEKHQGLISYSRRIDRPGYGELNPFRYFIDPYNFREGNPNLNPQYTHVFEAKYVFAGLYSIAFNYSRTEDAMTQIAKQIDSIHTTYIITENLDANDNYSVTVNVPLNLTTWWESSNNILVYNNSYQGISSVGEVDQRMTTLSFNSYNTFVLPHGWRAELGGYYNSKALYGTTISNPVGSVFMGISKSFLKDKFTLRAQINDIFHTEITTSVIKYQNIDVNFKRVYDSQFIRLHLSYSFGKKTVARARQHNTSSQDEQNRINNTR